VFFNPGANACQEERGENFFPPPKALPAPPAQYRPPAENTGFFPIAVFSLAKKTGRS
jgi:hypothetical protein